MSKPLIPQKLPYVDENNSIEDVVNYMSKIINGTTSKSISDSISRIVADSLPIGTIVHSLLTESQFQEKLSTNWVLFDNRSIAGSLLSTLYGSSTLPDARGAVLRGKDHGLGRNPDGDTALGTYQADEYESHSHTIPYIASGGSGGTNRDLDPNVNPATMSSGSSGGNETRMKNITVNIFIKIN